MFESHVLRQKKNLENSGFFSFCLDFSMVLQTQSFFILSQTFLSFFIFFGQMRNEMRNRKMAKKDMGFIPMSFYVKLYQTHFCLVENYTTPINSVLGIWRFQGVFCTKKKLDKAADNAESFLSHIYLVFVPKSENQNN